MQILSFLEAVCRSCHGARQGASTQGAVSWLLDNADYTSVLSDLVLTTEPCQRLQAELVKKKERRKQKCYQVSSEISMLFHSVWKGADGGGSGLLSFPDSGMAWMPKRRNMQKQDSSLAGLCEWLQSGYRVAQCVFGDSRVVL